MECFQNKYFLKYFDLYFLSSEIHNKIAMNYILFKASNLEVIFPKCEQQYPSTNWLQQIYCQSFPRISYTHPMPKHYLKHIQMSVL